jgi:hypothetical protein
MRCAGALFEAGESGLEFEVTHESSLVDSVLAFAYSMSVVPAVWHSLNCDTPDQQGHSTPSAVDMMARETRSRIIENVGLRTAPLLQLKFTVTDRSESVPAPLAVALKGTKRRPPLVASFIDTTAPRSSLTAAKRNTAFLFEVIRDWSSTAKFVVVRGDDARVGHYAEFFNVTSVSTENLGPLYDASVQAVAELVGRP